MHRIFPIIIVCLFFSAAAFAQLDGNPENWCRNGAFPRESENFKLGTIKAKKGEKIYFYGDDEDCPKGKNCRLKSYLISGDRVIISRTYDNFACVWYQPKNDGETVGWIPLDKLEFIEIVPNAALSDWIGIWRYYDNSIEIVVSKKRGFLDISGNAFWKGLGDNIHIGELDGEAKLTGTKLEYGAQNTGEYDCRVTMRLLGDFMIVSDNLNCGGANVTFSGVYRRKRSR